LRRTSGENTGFKTLLRYFELAVETRAGFLNRSGGDKIFTVKDLHF